MYSVHSGSFTRSLIQSFAVLPISTVGAYRIAHFHVISCFVSSVNTIIKHTHTKKQKRVIVKVDFAQSLESTMPFAKFNWTLICFMAQNSTPNNFHHINFGLNDQTHRERVIANKEVFRFIDFMKWIAACTEWTQQFSNGNKIVCATSSFFFSMHFVCITAQNLFVLWASTSFLCHFNDDDAAVIGCRFYCHSAICCSAAVDVDLFEYERKKLISLNRTIKIKWWSKKVQQCLAGEWKRRG